MPTNLEWETSVLNRPLGEWKEPEPPEEHMTPSERRAWRRYCELDRQHHEAIKAEYEATRKDGQGFVDWAWERQNRQMSEAMDKIMRDCLPRPSDGPFVHIKKS